MPKVSQSFFDGSARIGAGNLNGDQNGLLQTVIFSSSTHVDPSSLRRILVTGELEGGVLMKISLGWNVSPFLLARF